MLVHGGTISEIAEEVIARDSRSAGAHRIAAQERDHVAEIGAHPANQDGDHEQDEADGVVPC